MGLRSDIVALLTSSDVALTDFRLFGHRICGTDYGHIAGAVRNGHIQIVQASWDPVNGRAWDTTRAAYNKAFNCFLVGAEPSDSLLVHEATHAINDWYGRALMPVEDEGIAYVAQMVYLCRHDPAIQMLSLSGDFARNTSYIAAHCGRDAVLCNQAVIGYATLVAGALRVGETPSASLMRDFRQALHHDPGTLFPDSIRQYNHIERTTIPADFIAGVRGTLVTA